MHRWETRALTDLTDGSLEEGRYLMFARVMLILPIYLFITSENITAITGPAFYSSNLASN
jgi:hypothetical protein